MTRSAFPSVFSKFLLTASLALLLSMPALAVGRRTAPGDHPHRVRVSNPVTQAFLQLWSYVAGALTKEGCGIDPDGLCLPGGLAPASLDAGCGLDPSGRCLPGT